MHKTIEDYSPFKLNREQVGASILLEEFFNQHEIRTFLMKGYAGTGKTTLINAVLRYLDALQVPVTLMATTGRAAKILSNKTNERADTIHKIIYKIDKEIDDKNKKIKRFFYKIRYNSDANNKVYIIDESSMLSDSYSGKNTTGTGRLLNDLLTYIGNRKVIFVGDPAQLPPVNCDVSPALSEQYLAEKYKRYPYSFALKAIMRYSKDSGIFANTEFLRTIMKHDTVPNSYLLSQSFSDVYTKHSLDALIENYLEAFRKNNPDDITFIVYANATAAIVNNIIRSRLYNQPDILVKNERLIVMQNNYLYMLFNGESIEILSFSDKTEQRAGLTFRKVFLRVNEYNTKREFNAYIIEDFLINKQVSLSPEQEYALFQDFIIRLSMRNVKIYDEDFMDYLTTDPYVNALRVKYGYAITCHKAQGGEWDKVFVYVEKNLASLKTKGLSKWLYTAFSRAIISLHVFSEVFKIEYQFLEVEW
jgi:DNA polymerase III delta prime subunit